MRRSQPHKEQSKNILCVRTASAKIQKPERDLCWKNQKKKKKEREREITKKRPY